MLVNKTQNLTLIFPERADTTTVTFHTYSSVAPRGSGLHLRSRQPDRQPLLAVANEISGTTTIYAIKRS